MKEKNLVLLAAKPTELLISVFRKKQCLVCFKKFSVLFTEEHAADCSSKLKPLYVNSADETDDGKIDINK